MPTLLQILLLAAFAAAFVLTLRRGRQGVLSRTETFLWCLLWFAAGLVVLRPEVTSLVAGLLGVGRGVDAVTYVAIAVLFSLTFRIFLRLDKIDRDITELVRREALRDGGKKE